MISGRYPKAAFITDSQSYRFCGTLMTVSLLKLRNLPLEPFSRIICFFGRIHFNHDLILHELCDNFSIFALFCFTTRKNQIRKVYRLHKTNIPEFFVFSHVSGSDAIMKGIINLEKCQNCCKKICCNNLPPFLPGCFAGKLSQAG